MPPTTLTGSLHPSNKDAIAWHEKGIIVFGCHSTLVFLDVRRLEIFQTLEQHITAINLVCWRTTPNLVETFSASIGELRCASSDISGNIIVWDVSLGEVLASFRHANSQVLDIAWYIPTHLAGRDFLLSLHSNNSLILWDIGKRERFWEHKFTMSVFKFSISSFDMTKLALSSTGTTILLADELLPTSRQPKESSQITSISLEPKTVVPNAGNKSAESGIVQLKHHAAVDSLLFVLFPKELCVVHTEHKQVIYSAIIDAGTPLLRLLPCARRDALFLVHQSGLVTFRVASLQLSYERVSASLEYQRKCLADPVHRQATRVRLMGAALCPVTQFTLALLMNTGRIQFYQLENSKEVIEPYRLRSIEDVLELDDHYQGKCGELRLTLFGCYSPLCSSVSVVRMRPMSWDDIQLAQQQQHENLLAVSGCHDKIPHLAAVGTSSGVIHLIDVYSGRIVRNFQVHTCPVKCLEWGGPNAVVSSAYIASFASSNMVRNDVFMTDIRTGQKRRIRPEQEESPIEMIRVSHYHSYLAIAFRVDPLEIWDLGTMRLLRRMSKRCPIIVDMCWSGKHHQARKVNERTQIYRENLVVMDNDNHLYHVVVKGLHVRDGKEVSTQWKSGAAFLRCMVWKDDMLAFGDSAGRVGVWDLVRSQCRQSGLSQSTRGPVLRTVFSKMIGDYTLAAQHPTSLVVWDTEKLQAVHSFQRPGLSVIDIDMCGLTPVYLSSDGMFRFALLETVKGRNASVNDSEVPLLLQMAYQEALHQLVVVENGWKSIENELVQADPDYAYLGARLASLKSPIGQRVFLHQFVGNQALADLCRIVESQNGGEEEGRKKEKLPTNLLLFWDKKAYIDQMEQFTRLLLSTCLSSQQLEQAIEKCIVMKKIDLAMYYLLNNDHPPHQSLASQQQQQNELRLNAFRACVLAAKFETEESKCLVKLTATNLIASNFVSEGIQLLSLIDQGLDACKYLISQGLWKESLSYAKMNPKCDFVEVYSRYADHLIAESHMSQALMVLANLGKWGRYKEILALTAAEPIIINTLRQIIETRTAGELA